MLTRREPLALRLADERRLDRRRFLRVAGATAGLALAGEWVRRLLGDAPPAPETVRLPEAAAMAPGEARAVASPGRAGGVLVVRLDPETVVAFDRRCPHLGCPVLWSAERSRFECPCHRAAFDARTGRVLFGPPRRGLATVEVET